MARIANLVALVVLILGVLHSTPAAGSALDVHSHQRRSALSHHADIIKRSQPRRRCPARSKASSAAAPASSHGADNKPTSNGTPATPHTSSSSSSSQSHSPQSIAHPVNSTHSAAPSTHSTAPSTHAAPSPTHQSSAAPASTSSKVKAEGVSTKPPPPKSTPKPPPPKTQAPPPPAPASPGKKGKKVMLAFTGGNGINIDAFVTSHVFAGWNWSPQCPPQIAQNNLQCVASLQSFSNTGNWVSTIKSTRPAIACGFNEVNQPGQTQIDVGTGISAWQKYMSPLVGTGVELCSHSVSNGPTGIAWLKQFAEQCSSCWAETSLINAHYYGDDPQGLISYMNQLRSELPGNKDIIITEFGCTNFGSGGDCPNPSSFLSTVTNWAENNTFVRGYNWFGLSTPGNLGGGVNVNNALAGSNGNPNSLGGQYINS